MRAPSQADCLCPGEVKRRYRAREIVLFQWRKAKTAECFVLGRGSADTRDGDGVEVAVALRAFDAHSRTRIATGSHERKFGTSVPASQGKERFRCS